MDPEPITVKKTGHTEIPHVWSLAEHHEHTFTPRGNLSRPTNWEETRELREISHGHIGKK